MKGEITKNECIQLDDLIYLDEATRGYSKDNSIGDIVHNLRYKDGNEANDIGTITTDYHGYYNPDNPETQNCMMPMEEWIDFVSDSI